MPNSHFSDPKPLFILQSLQKLEQNIILQAVIMNSLSQFSRWNRFRLLKAKETTPEPSPSKFSQGNNPKSANRSICNHPQPTPQTRRVKEALTLTIKHQNRCPSYQESSSLSTKYNLPRNNPKSRTNHSRNKGDQENSLSMERFISGGRPLSQRRKVNYSILQRIRKTLELYPNISHEILPKSPKIITFATQSSDEAHQTAQTDAINLQKLVLWRESKIIKTIERIYEYLMGVYTRFSQASPKRVKTTQRISMKGEMKRYLLHRYKTQKLCKENFINLLYSLYYYCDKYQYEHSLATKTPKLAVKLRTLEIFENFISFEYNEDDLIFYLYSRNIFNELLSRGSRSDEAYFVTGQQVRKFLNVLANGDACIVRYYEQYLIRMATKDQQPLQVGQILYLLLTNFQLKKSKTTLHPSISISQETTKSPKPYQKSENLSRSMLTIAIDNSFWQTEPPPQQAIPDLLYDKLLSQIGTQTKKLMSYFHTQGSLDRDATAELILIKAIRMLNAVHRMDKYRWFQEMQLVKDKVLVAKSEDFQQIQALQRQMRGIEQSQREGRLEKRRIVEFSKRLLTVRAFVDRLEQLFDAVENNYVWEQ